jgi:hypothetical protein
MLMTLASSTSRILFVRSWVIGRGGVMPSRTKHIELASNFPIQIGSISVSVSSLRMTIYMFVWGSKTRPLTFMIYICCPPNKLSEKDVKNIAY